MTNTDYKNLGGNKFYTLIDYHGDKNHHGFVYKSKTFLGCFYTMGNNDGPCLLSFSKHRIEWSYKKSGSYQTEEKYWNY